MGINTETTREQILEAGRQEFLDKGFKDASMRTIASQAGVTTGAIYGYFPDKEALFNTLVDHVAEGLKRQFIKAQNNFSQLPDTKQIELMYAKSSEELYALLAYVYDNFEEFRLIVCCSGGTQYEYFVDSLVNIETEATSRFIEVINRNGYKAESMKQNLVHILSNAYFSAVFETVAHNMAKDEAYAYVEQITTFFSAGWHKLLGLS